MVFYRRNKMSKNKKLLQDILKKTINGYGLKDPVTAYNFCRNRSHTPEGKMIAELSFLYLASQLDIK
jgi:hypothetical protein